MEKLPNSKYKPNKALFDDEKMYEFIFKAYFPRLMAFTKKIIRDKNIAEDIIQDVFLKVWVKRKEIEEESFQSYIFTLVRNACLNHLKHQQIVNNYQTKIEDTSREEVLYYADFFSDPFHQTVYSEIQHEIDKAIQELPEQTSRVFRLSRFEGMKNSEIAEMLNVSIRTVEKHNTKALQKLKDHLSSHYLYAIAVLDLIHK
ncbi:MAG TPA: RNA polymerase sigma-70 factor [Prolixibacteraceae bacterium]|nr:RNA polymerase sigma-70 factor [Prolixibacteraceae bacterium]